MQVNSASSNTGSINAFLGQSATPAAAKKEDPLGRDAFLSMLVTQLKNQDPLNPMQGADFSAQLAQFSSLEQLFNVNDNLESLKGSVDSSDDGNLLDFIGKEVLSRSNTLSLKDGKSTGGYYHLEEAASVVVNIYDGNGDPVGQIKAGEQAAGNHEIEWNGLDVLGDAYPNGDYSYEVLTLDEKGVYKQVDTGISGKITGVTFEQGKPYLLMDDRLVSPDTVVKVWEAGASPAV